MHSESSPDFAASVIDGLRSTPVARIAAPCGKAEGSALEALIHAAIQAGYATAQVEASVLETREDLFRELSRALAFERDATNIEEFIPQIQMLYQGRVVFIVGAFIHADAATILDAARLIAEVTRDLGASIKVVWSHDGAQVAVAPLLSFEVWPSEWRDIPQLSFADGLDAILNRAFRHYIDRRVYWEAAGQGDSIQEIGEFVSSRSNLVPSSQSVDETLSKIFDSVPISKQARSLALEHLSEIANHEVWVEAMTHGSFPRVDKGAIKKWYAGGLIWQPPGMYRWRVTSVCIRLLCEEDGHPITRSIGILAVRAAMVSARANPQLSQMVLILTTQIESELLSKLRRVPDCTRMLNDAGLLEDLEKQQKRSRGVREYFIQSERSILDYASFGQLVRLVQFSGSGFKFPLSYELLRDIANIRNLAAHGQPIRWDGLRCAVEAVYALQR